MLEYGGGWGPVEAGRPDIDVKYHHVQDKQAKGSIHVTSTTNPANLLTKLLAVPRHEQLLQLPGLVQTDQYTKGEGRTSDSYRKEGV